METLESSPQIVLELFNMAIRTFPIITVPYGKIRIKMFEYHFIYYYINVLLYSNILLLHLMETNG